MTEQEKRKKLDMLPWQALFDLAISKEIDEAQLKGKDKGIIISKLLSEAMLSDSEIDKLVNCIRRSPAAAGAVVNGSSAVTAAAV